MLRSLVGSEMCIRDSTKTEKCCGMPKLELGDIDSVAKAKDINVPELYNLSLIHI